MFCINGNQINDIWILLYDKKYVSNINSALIKYCLKSSAGFFFIFTFCTNTILSETIKHVY